jgi:hypothetical protein
MWIQEIEFDMSQDPPVCLSEGGFQNVGEVTVAELRIAAEQEFGSFVEDITDPDNNDVPIGWKFRTQATYEDPENGAEFDLETWIVLHDEPPEMKFRYHVIKDEELAILSHIESLVQGAEDAEVEDTGIEPSVSVQEILSSLGSPLSGTGDIIDEEAEESD